MSAITPFDPNVEKDEVDRLFRKLGDTRLPRIPVVPDAGGEYGMLYALLWFCSVYMFVCMFLCVCGVAIAMLHTHIHTYIHT